MICWSLPLVNLESILYERGRTVLMTLLKRPLLFFALQEDLFFLQFSHINARIKFILTVLDS